MGAKRRVVAAKQFAFVYLNHGSLDLDSIGRCDGAYLGFVDAVPDEVKMAIRERCPSPIRGGASFLDNLLSIESPDDTYNFAILEEFGTEADKLASDDDWPTISQETADRFSAAVDAWIQYVHSLYPLVFAMGPGNTNLNDPWNAWSKQNFTNVFVPFIDAFIYRNPGITEEDDLDYDPSDIKALSHGHIACLLQEFEPYHELPVPSEHVQRVTQLCEMFEL